MSGWRIRIPLRPALTVHVRVQLLAARVCVQTLTEHGPNRECRRRDGKSK